MAPAALEGAVPNRAMLPPHHLTLRQLEVHNVIEVYIFSYSSRSLMSDCLPLSLSQYWSLTQDTNELVVVMWGELHGPRTVQ